MFGFRSPTLGFGEQFHRHKLNCSGPADPAAVYSGSEEQAGNPHVPGTRPQMTGSPSADGSADAGRGSRGITLASRNQQVQHTTKTDGLAKPKPDVDEKTAKGQGEGGCSPHPETGSGKPAPFDPHAYRPNVEPPKVKPVGKEDPNRFRRQQNCFRRQKNCEGMPAEFAPRHGT